MKFEDLTEKEKYIAWFQIEAYLYDEEDEPDIDKLMKAIMDEKIPVLRWTGNVQYTLDLLIRQGGGIEGNR